jgi:DedD protein
MALFKFRLPGQGEASDGRRRAGASTSARNAAPPAESVESLRQRARHRVIGATVLVVVAVIGFPMLFDTEPRPVGPDVAFHIPDRDKAPPLDDARPAEPVQAQDSLNEHEEVVTGDATEAPGAAARVSDADRAAREQAELAAREKADQEARERADKAAQERAAQEKAAQDKAVREKAAREKAARDKAAREKAERDKRLAQEKTAREKAEAGKDKAGRFVVQVGSFAEDARAREARSTLERAGIPTYIQVIDTKDGKRTRVRVGPFGSRSEAEAAAQKVKALGLYSGIAEL